VAWCEPKSKTGPAFQLGIYDTATRSPVAQKAVTLEDAGDGEYRAYDLGAYALTPGMYVWIAPMGNPGLVDAVVVDRIYFVREH
jgi:hypothetical protein